MEKGARVAKEEENRRLKTTWKNITFVQFPSFTNMKSSPVSLMFRLNVSLQCTMVSKLFVTHVTVIRGPFVLCKFMPPQVSLVCER